MKKILILLAALLTHGLAEDEARQAVLLPVVEDKRPWPDVPVSKIDLTSNQTVNDAVKQIIAGLPPEGRMAFVVEVPYSVPAVFAGSSEYSRFSDQWLLITK